MEKNSPSAAPGGRLISPSNPFCLLTRSIKSLLAENRRSGQDLGRWELGVGRRPGAAAASLDVTFYCLLCLLCSSEERRLFKAPCRSAFDRACTNFIHLTFIWLQTDNICKHKSTGKEETKLKWPCEGWRGGRGRGREIQTENCLQTKVHDRMCNNSVRMPTFHYSGFIQTYKVPEDLLSV